MFFRCGSDVRQRTGGNDWITREGVEIGLPRPTLRTVRCALVHRVTHATVDASSGGRAVVVNVTSARPRSRFRFPALGRLSCSPVTEIPEHLLKRSKAAKAKAEGGEAPADAPAAGSSSAPATVAAATPAAAAKPAAPAKPAGPPPPKPDIPVVAAAKARKRIPFWAMATLSLLPLWTFMYVRGLTFKEAKVSGPLGEGAEIYTANCSGCHGAAGEGGVGYGFAGGEVLKTFPHIEDQLRFVYAGSQAYANEGIAVYGNPERSPLHNTLAKGQMPAQGPTAGGGLTEAQILAVVCHERYTLGGADPTADYLEEYEKWCSPEAPAWVGFEDGSITFDNVADQLEGTFVVGTTPLAGHAPDAEP
jgi:mono/diheme cytochrome c family protein